jgi:hypothetical protein
LEPRHLQQDWWKRQGGKLVDASDIPADAKLIADTDKDWPNDLNACHEFEEKLDEKQRKEYARFLNEGYGMIGMNLSDGFLLLHATAEQRCRAFVATMEARSVASGLKSDNADGVSSPNQSAMEGTKP